jgi:ABC-2 type transport system ATP-binding protein
MTDAMIRVQDLRKAYGSTVAVDDISFDVAEGEIFGILGPNGAGKTTTVESVAGLRRGDAGSVRVAGIDPWSDRDALTRVLGVQLQDSQLQPRLLVREALELWTAFYDDPFPWRQLAERLGLTPHLDQRFANLSGGQQQRLAIALALVGRPRVVILDELTTGLDPRARRDAWGLVRDVRDSGVTVVLVTHAMEEAQHLCDRVAIIDAGTVRAIDSPEGLVRGAAAATVMSFAPGRALPLEELAARSGAARVRLAGERVVVEGDDEAVLAALHWLGSHGVVPHGLRVVDGSLDDAYLDLTRPALRQEAEVL